VKAWVEKLAGKLRKKGYDVRVDTESKSGSSVPEWCRERADQADAVLLICTPEYKAKILSKKGYLWDEALVIEARWSRRGQNHGVIPLLRSGDAGDSVPDFCGSRGMEHLDFRRDDHFEADLAALDKEVQDAIAGQCRERAQMESSFADTQHGIILMADVVNFTMIPWADQERIMERMMAFTDSTFAPESEDARIIMPMLDGIAIIWKNQNTFVEACETARKLIHHMENGNPGVIIRTGLHIGSYSVGKSKQAHYFGNALNDCRRICQIGDHKHIVMSESFCQKWLERERDHPLQQNIFPTTADNPIQVYPWRLKDGCIRLLKEGDDRVPMELEVRDIASNWLSQLIEYIGKSVMELVEDKHGIKAAKQGLRVALWAPNPERRDELTATEFRWPKREDNGQPPSRTTYHIVNEGEPPAGRAFCSGEEVVIIHGLPPVRSAKDSGKALQKYYEAMQAHGIRLETLQKFSRHARAFLCFAFPILLESHDAASRKNGGGIRQPFGVICMDFLDPLADVSKKELCQLATEIREVFQTELTLAWRART